MVACTVLLALIVLFGAPLLVKFDNGGAFVGGDLKEVLEEGGITPLTSPPYTPEYNGACERSGGTFKLRADHIAKLQGHPGRWRAQNIDDALLVANTTARPWGGTGPTPAQVFEQRRSVTGAEREAFNEETGTMPTCSQRAAITRKATRLVLCELGDLQIRRGRLSTPVSTWKAGLQT